MRIGFTGTRKGMTKKQSDVLRRILIGNLSDINTGINEFNHGNCIGADEEAAIMAHELKYTVFAHHPMDVNKSSDNLVKINDVNHEPKPYLERNRNIVKATDFIVATPSTKEEVLRSGTWATIRYAKDKLKKPYYIIYPDGEYIEGDGNECYDDKKPKEDSDKTV